MSVSSKRNSLHYFLPLAGETMEKELSKPFTFLTSVPGKKIRHNLIKVLGYWIPVAEDKIPYIEELAHYTHNTSLLVDDMQDHSALRRSIPTAHTVYGVPKTLFSVNWNMGKIYGLLDQLDNIKLTKLYLRMLVGIFAGQGMDVYWRDNYICPTEEEYLEMIYRKTGLGFLQIQKIMNIFNTGKVVDTAKLLTTLGIYFQINDDYQNLNNQFYFDSKGFCEDISEGKFSFPMVHAINNFPEDGKIIMDILQQRTYDVELKKQCLTILEKCGSFEHTKKKLEELKNIVYEEIAKLDENPLIDEFIEKAMVTCL